MFWTDIGLVAVLRDPVTSAGRLGLGGEPLDVPLRDPAIVGAVREVVDLRVLVALDARADRRGFRRCYLDNGGWFFSRGMIREFGPYRCLGVNDDKHRGVLRDSLPATEWWILSDLGKSNLPKPITEPSRFYRRVKLSENCLYGT